MSGSNPAGVRPHARDDVVFRRLAEDFAILDPAAQQVHVLNATAAAVWTLCDGSRGVDHIAAEVAQAFGVEPNGAVEADVRTALAAFADRGLLR